MSRKSGRLNVGESSPAVNLKNISNHHMSGLGFINKQYNHPAFNRINVGFNNTSKANCYDSGIISKPPKAPEKPVMPYMKYHHKIVDKVKASRPDLRNFEITKVIGLMWQDLGEEERKVFQDEYEDERMAYQEVQRLCQSSGSYQNFLRGSRRTEMNDMYEKQVKRESAANVFVESMPEDADATDISAKHISSARFHLNQRLMNDILSDCNTVVTGDNIVTVHKLESKRRQVEILKRHCNNLCKEVNDLEKKHAESKRKWSEQKNNFIKKLNGPLTTAAHEHHHELKISSFLYGLSPTAEIYDSDMMKLTPKKPKLANSTSQSTEEKSSEVDVDKKEKCGSSAESQAEDCKSEQPPASTEQPSKE